MDYIGHMGSASLLVLRLTNVHLDADAETIRRYFKGYRIVDQIRAINPKTRYPSVVYVMFASVEERNRAYKSLNLGTILGRQVYLMPAHTGNYRINASYNGFVHGREEQKVAVKPEPAAFKGLSNSDFPALGKSDHTLSLKVPVSPKHRATHDRFLEDEQVEVVNSTCHPAVTLGTISAGSSLETGDVATTRTTITKPPIKLKEQDRQIQSPEKPKATPGTKHSVLSGRAPLIANRTPQPAPEFSRGISEWLWNMPITLQNQHLNSPLPRPHPTFNLIVNGPPIPPFPREGPYSTAHDHLVQPDFSKTYDVFGKGHVPLVPLGGLWNLSRNVDPASSVVSESEWYSFMFDLGRENHHRLGVGQTVADRINREAGCEDGAEESVVGEREVIAIVP